MAAELRFNHFLVGVDMYPSDPPPLKSPVYRMFLGPLVLVFASKKETADFKEGKRMTVKRFCDICGNDEARSISRQSQWIEVGASRLEAHQTKPALAINFHLSANLSVTGCTTSEPVELCLKCTQRAMRIGFDRALAEQAQTWPKVGSNAN